MFQFGVGFSFCCELDKFNFEFAAQIIKQASVIYFWVFIILYCGLYLVLENTTIKAGKDTLIKAEK